jgi:hypothetical protein
MKIKANYTRIKELTLIIKSSLQRIEYPPKQSPLSIP